MKTFDVSKYLYVVKIPSWGDSTDPALLGIIGYVSMPMGELVEMEVIHGVTFIASECNYEEGMAIDSDGVLLDVITMLPQEPKTVDRVFGLRSLVEEAIESGLAERIEIPREPK